MTDPWMAAPWIEAPWMAPSWMVVILQTLGKSKLFFWLWVSHDRWSFLLTLGNSLHQNSLRRNWIPEKLSGLLPCHWHSILASQTCEGLHQLWALPNYFRLATSLIVQASSFLIHPHFWTQSVRLPLITYPLLRSTCVTYRTPCHASGHHILPTLEKQGISIGMASILSMCLCSHT